MLEDILPVIMYSFLGVLIVGNELVRRRAMPYDALFFFNISYFVYFVVAPIHVLIGGVAFTRYHYVSDNYGLGDGHNALWIVICYISVCFGYSITPRMKKKISTDKIHNRTWWVIILFLLSVATFSTVVYSLSVGGVVTAFKQAIYIRMGAFHVYSPFLFLKHFIPLFSSVLILSVALLLRDKSSKKKVPVYYYFVIPLFLWLFLYSAIVMGGRRVILIPLMMILFVYSNYKKKWSFKYVSGFVVFFCFVAVFWNAISFGIRDANFSQYLSGRYSSLRSVYASLCRPLADPYMGWVGISNMEVAWLGFADLITAPLQLLPGQLIAKTNDISLLNYTTVCLKGLDRTYTAEAPPGFIGYFYLNCGYIGIVFGGIVFGMLGKVLHNLFLPRLRDPVGLVIYTWMVFSWAYFLRHGMFEFILTERFHWWFACITIVSILSFRIALRRFHTHSLCTDTKISHDSL